jgi:hypothetical protein
MVRWLHGSCAGVLSAADSLVSDVETGDMVSLQVPWSEYPEYPEYPKSTPEYGRHGLAAGSAPIGRMYSRAVAALLGMP